MAAPDTDTPAYYILAAFDSQGRLSSTLRMIKTCVPDKYRGETEATLTALVRDGLVVQVKKDTYRKVVKL